MHGLVQHSPVLARRYDDGRGRHSLCAGEAQTTGEKARKQSKEPAHIQDYSIEIHYRMTEAATGMKDHGGEGISSPSQRPDKTPFGNRRGHFGAEGDDRSEVLRHTFVVSLRGLVVLAVISCGAEG